MNHSASLSPSVGSSKLRSLLWFVAIATLIWIQQSLPCWRDGQWLAGSHADGPFHFYCELTRMTAGAFPNDLAVQSNQSLGSYETTYRGVAAVAKATGCSLIATNLVFCWLGNFLYLGGIMVFLHKLKLAPVWCALGTFLAAQPFILISMSSGVVHSLVIPREFWLWPLPWLVMWFALGQRDGWRLVCFYAVLGAVYGMTYPLWAVLFGLAFGLADSWRFWREKRRSGFAWLAVGGFVCLALVVAPALGLARTAAGGESAVLDYNKIVQSVYFGKGFRRLLIFSALGWIAFRMLGKLRIESVGWRKLQTLLGASFGVCLIYEPFQRLFPTLSLLYLGRLSLVAYLISMLAVALWLSHGWRVWQLRGRGLALALLVFLMIDPVKHVFRDLRDQSPPVQVDFINFCRLVKKEVPVDGLCIVPLDRGCHYFRVYAERSLWISPKDTGVLSRTRDLYKEAWRRLKILESFYAEDSTPAQRDDLLNQLKTNGVTHVVTKTNCAWSASLSWPVVQSQGEWQLRVPPQTP